MATKKGLPPQGAKAILDAWADANEEVLKQKKNKSTKEEENKRFRDFVNNND